MMFPKSGSLSACLALAAVPALLLTGCAAVSTYPPVAGRPVNTPSVSPGPEVMAGAIKEAHRVTAPGTDIVFNLPAGLPENTWNRVAYLLPDSARAMEPGDENVYSVKQLRISGGSAEVDVVYPEGGVYQLMTVKFNGGPLASWTVAWHYRWLIPTEKPVMNDPLQLAEAAQLAETADAPSESAPSRAAAEDNMK